MGLDMYLTGELFYRFDHQFRKQEPFPIKATHYELGYWRKHPNLHGYIVQEFADGEDECQEISLIADNLTQIIGAIQSRLLPATTGFFFGESTGSDQEAANDITIFENALRWLTTDELGVWHQSATEQAGKPITAQLIPAAS